MAGVSSLQKKPSTGKHAKPPVLKVTQYDRVSSLMVAIALALAIAAGWLFLLWTTTWRPQPEALADIEILDARAGFEDGDEEEEFPEIDNPAEELQMEEQFESVIEHATSESMQAFQQFEMDPVERTSPQSGTGSGRPLGVPGGTGTGLPRDQRWFVRFADRTSLDEYARQLDHFGIELGYLVLGNDSMVVLSNLSSPSPRKRTVTASSLGKDKMHFNWKGGSRQQADLKLLEKAGIRPAPNGVIFHFYPRSVQQQLIQAETGYRNRRPDQIRRTYFVVKREGSGYTFEVVRQSIF